MQSFDLKILTGLALTFDLNGNFSIEVFTTGKGEYLKFWKKHDDEMKFHKQEKLGQAFNASQAKLQYQTVCVFDPNAH